MVVLAGGSFHAGWSIVKLIAVLVLVLVLAYYTTRFIAQYQNNSLGGKSNIQFIESYRVGGNKVISIVRIGEQFYALGIGKDEIHVIDKLDADCLHGLEAARGEDAGEKASFKEVLAKMKNKNSKDDSEE